MPIPAQTAANPQLLKLLVGAMIFCGVFLRFYHVDHKAFWDDEVVTWMHIQGVYESEVVTQGANFHRAADLRAVLHPVSGLRPISAVIGSLRAEDPQHPPLYYQIAHLWVSLFGDSVAAVRTLSAIFGVLAIPCMYWLCVELFGSPAAGWAGAALVATAPIDVLYSQEAREYSLWLLCTLVSSALFLRAIRLGTLRASGLYALALAVSLYVFPLSTLIAAAHAVVAIGARASMRSKLYAIGAMALAGLIFVPWLLIIVGKFTDINSSMSHIVAATSLRVFTVRHTISLVRLDVIDWDGAHQPFVVGATIPIIGLLLLAIYDIRRQRSQVTRLFVWALLGSIAVPLIGWDLAVGGHRVETARYFIPMFLALDLCLAALIATKLSPKNEPASRVIWTGIIVMVFALRISSSAMSSQATTWWNSYHMRSHEVATLINASRHPLVASDDYILWPLVLSEYLAPDTEIALRPRCYLCKVTQNASSPLPDLATGGDLRDLFLLAPSNALRSAAQAQVRDKPTALVVNCIEVRGSCPGGGIDLWSTDH
jgi:uncharacterized membrane protein